MIPLGELKLQKKNPINTSYKAFIPYHFPPKNFEITDKTIRLAEEATRILGKLDGIAILLPDREFFLKMYIRKDATASSQIEGTMATMVDAIEAESKTSADIPEDVDDILHYIKALDYGIKRIKNLPMSLRFIRDIHKVLMTDARSTHFSDPGKFRESQNWIGGTSVNNARYVPPTPEVMKENLYDLEKFMVKDYESLPLLVKVGLIHAQFEMIHPFLDGNGRTGRLLVTLGIWSNGLLDNPVLFLSSYFKQHQKIYYEKLDSYHEGNVDEWIKFFLEAIIETSNQSIETVRKITELRQRDILKIQTLGSVSAKGATEILPHLFQLPIVNVNTIQEWTGFTRQGSQKVIDRFVKLGILKQKDNNVTYGRSFIYKEYVDIFQ